MKKYPIKWEFFPWNLELIQLLQEGLAVAITDG